MIEKLQFISQENTSFSHLDSIKAACEAGVKWVQLRVKNKSAEEVLALALEARAISRQYGAKLIINDKAEIALQADADGVHLGKEDMPIREARKIVGNRIIGATANTFEDIQQHALDGADYIGLGPFRFTATKEKLSPILGLVGYASLMESCREKAISVPVVAIGGIAVADLPAIMETGVHGIAVSSLIARAADQQELVEKILKLLEKERTAHA